MNLAMIFAALLQAGVCAEVPFTGRDGSTLRVIVCPRLSPAPAAPEGEDMSKPPKPGQTDN